jgi:hypothetical protein
MKRGEVEPGAPMDVVEKGEVVATFYRVGRQGETLASAILMPSVFRERKRGRHRLMEQNGGGA